jgi:hypothetical protein
VPQFEFVTPIGSLKDKTLPTVQVSIGEEHFGRRIIDPAAETEFAKMLQECGFKLVDEMSTNRAEVTITGHAFSGYGMQKGNLVSCKSRVELKVRNRNGDILAVDRQKSAAVDITEQTAAKTALHNAAGELAERIIPKLGR